VWSGSRYDSSVTRRPGRFCGCVTGYIAREGGSICTQLILDAGIQRVVIAAREPALFVADPQGYELLIAAGVEVVELTNVRRSNQYWSPGESLR